MKGKSSLRILGEDLLEHIESGTMRVRFGVLDEMVPFNSNRRGESEEFFQTQEELVVDVAVGTLSTMKLIEVSSSQSSRGTIVICGDIVANTNDT